MTRDLRNYSTQTNKRLLIGFFTILIVVGIGSIYLFFGRNAAFMGLFCLGLALIPALIIWALLNAFEYITKIANAE
jgi:hypothetical protein